MLISSVKGNFISAKLNVEAIIHLKLQMSDLWPLSLLYALPTSVSA
jgi:hypothetical protein